MKTVTIQYQANYFQALEVPDNITDGELKALALKKRINPEFQDGSIEWLPVFWENTEDGYEWIIFD